MGKIVVKIGVLIVSRGKLLLIKEKSSHDNQYRWNIIKGTYEPEKDRSLLETAKREAMEEVGANIKNLRLFNVFEVKRDEETIIQFNFLANLRGRNFRLAHKHEQKRRNEDIIEIELFNKKSLGKMGRKDFLGSRSYLAVRDWLASNSELFKVLL